MRLDPAAVKVWRIGAGIVSLVIAVVIAISIFVKIKYFVWLSWWIPGGIVLVLLIQIIAFVILSPNLAYRTFRYYLGDTDLTIEKGIWIKRRILIPFVRIQNVETSVGPIMKRYNLKTLVITTAGGSEKIELLNAEVAESLKKEITEIIK